MKILFISQFAGSAHHGMVTRNYNWGIELKRLDHDVTIVASAYSHYRANNPDPKIEEETIDGIKYLWLKAIEYSGQSALGRIKAMANFQYRLWQFVKTNQEKYDLIIASSPQPFVIYSAHKMARKYHAKLIYDIRDLWPLTLKELGGMSKWHPFIMTLQHAENYACKHADIITAVPQNCKEYLIHHGMDDHKFMHIGNGYLEKDDNKCTPLPKDHHDLIKILKDQNKFIIGYAGTHGRANAMHIPIKAMVNTAPNIHLISIGNGVDKNSLKQLADDENLNDRVHFLDAIPHSSIPTFLSLIDVAYIGGMNSPLYKWGASPAKVNDYLMAEKPILYAMGDSNNPIEKSNCGICCPAENYEQMTQAMNKLYDMPLSEREEMGRRGKEWLFKNQLTSIQVKQILDKLS